MTAERWMRAADEDRETAVDVLRGAYAASRLRPEEFYERIDAAYADTTWGDLGKLTTDLPVTWTDVGLPSARSHVEDRERPDRAFPAGHPGARLLDLPVGAGDGTGVPSDFGGRAGGCVLVPSSCCRRSRWNASARRYGARAATAAVRTAWPAGSNPAALVYIVIRHGPKPRWEQLRDVQAGF
jgi:hypothetical protein